MFVKTPVRKIRPPKKRVCGDVPYPTTRELSLQELIGNTQLPRMGLLRKHLEGEGRLNPQAYNFIFSKARSLLLAERNVLEFGGKVLVVGDLHGQFYDLMTVIDIHENTNVGGSILFLGSYVEYGTFGVEVMLYLLALKICQPSKVFLLRGNHDCRGLTKKTFMRECQVKYDLKVYTTILSIFNALPLAALVNAHVFCVHGGISNLIHSISDINLLDRDCEPPEEGMITDLLWSDPHPRYGYEKGTTPNFSFNWKRGASVVFSSRAVLNFCEINNISHIIRGHQLSQDGFLAYNSQVCGYESLLSIFSAPNFMGTHRNKGVVVQLSPKSMVVLPFLWVSQPYWLPGFLDVFNWSMAFVFEKVEEMARALKKPVVPHMTPKRLRTIRAKILSLCTFITLWKEKQHLQTGDSQQESRTPHTTKPDLHIFKVQDENKTKRQK